MSVAIRKTEALWERHYRRDRSLQVYPDENLVRLLKMRQRERALPERNPGAALDLGCGKGRHIALLQELGYAPLYGSDTSSEALAYCRRKFPKIDLFALQGEQLLSDSFSFPLQEGSLSVVILWGVLHYNCDAAICSLLREARRLLAAEGCLYFTLRAATDSHFASNAAMQGASIRLFTEETARALLTAYFPVVELGYSERSPLGQLERRICHWFGQAKKSG